MFPSITVHGNDKIEIKYKFELGAGGKVAPIDDRWEKLYMRSTDLLTDVKGSSVAFRRKVFGIMRYSGDWKPMGEGLFSTPEGI